MVPLTTLHKKCLYFPAFGLNMDRYGVSLRIQSKCWKMRTRITEYKYFLRNATFAKKMFDNVLYTPLVIDRFIYIF